MTAMLNFLVWLGVTSNGQILNFQRFFEAIKQILAFQIPFKRIGAALLAAAELFFSGCFKTPIIPCGEAPDLTGYSLVFEDDFDGTELNSDVWYNRCEGTRRTGYNADSQATVKDGNLILTGEYRENGKFGAGWYTGMVALKENYNKGYFEIRCKCNEDNGFWSAFWIQALGDPYDHYYSDGGIEAVEIDIFESMSSQLCLLAMIWSRQIFIATAMITLLIKLIRRESAFSVWEIFMNITPTL